MNILFKNLIKESVQSGEWWIESDGSTIYADGEVGDSNHQGIIIQMLAHEILSHFGIEDDMNGMLDEYEESIKETLISDGRLSEEEINEWNTESPSEIILRKIIEDKLYPNDKQAAEALYIAYGGTSSRDPRDYAMEKLHWKVMKVYHGQIEIQTWHLKQEDLSIIVRGIWDILGDGDDNEEDIPDENGFRGPYVNVTVQATGKRFNNIPLEVLEKKMPQKVQGYQSGVNLGYTEGYIK